MKDTLKDFIHQNRDRFDDKEPGQGLWKKIESTLPTTKTMALWDSVLVWRAAAILFLGLAGYFFIIGRQSSVQKKEVAQLQVEFSDLESFYSTEIAEKVALIHHFDETGEAERFTQDFQKLDAMYQVLKEQMKTQPSQKVKDALILNLLVRIDLLNQQLHSLEQNKEEGKEMHTSA